MKLIFHAWNHHSDRFPTAGLCVCVCVTDLVLQDGEELHDAEMRFGWCGCWCFPPRLSLFWDCKENEYLCEIVTNNTFRVSYASTRIEQLWEVTLW